MKLKELQSQLKSQSEAQHITLAVLSNINFEPYFQLLINKAFAEIHLSINIIPVDYSEFLSGGIIEQIAETGIVAVLPNFESLYPEINNKNLNSDEAQTLIDAEISNMKQICSIIQSKSNSLLIWFGYEDYCSELYNTVGNIPIQNGFVDKLNLQISSKMENDIAYVDMKRLIANIGIANAYDNRNKYRWNYSYSQTMIEQICNEIYKQYLIINGKTKKCIVLDCDNVLWGASFLKRGSKMCMSEAADSDVPIKIFNDIFYFSTITA